MDIRKAFILFLILVVAFFPGCVQQEKPPVTTLMSAESTTRITSTTEFSTSIPSTTSTTTEPHLVTQTTTTTQYVPVIQNASVSQKNDSNNSSIIKAPRYGEVKAAITLNKPMYHSGEPMAITIKINSQKRIDVNVNIYGIFAGYYRLNQTQAVVLNPGINVVSFNYPSPPCNKCAGVAEGIYVISVEVLYNDNVVTRDNKNVELKQ